MHAQKSLITEFLANGVAAAEPEEFGLEIGILHVGLEVTHFCNKFGEYQALKYRSSKSAL